RSDRDWSSDVCSSDLNTGDQTFALPSTYEPNTKTLWVYKDWVVQPPSEYIQDSNTTFKFIDPLKGGEKIWARWARNVALYTPARSEERRVGKEYRSRV